MKERRKKRWWLPAVLVVLLSGMLFPENGITRAASSYTNAKEFYESTGSDGYHIEAYGGTIYYATKAKLASSSGNLKYGTVGYDIVLSGNGQTVQFSVKRNGNGSMQEILDAQVTSGNYMYNLYSIPAEKLFNLATNANPQAAAAVLSGSFINIRIDAIMTTKKNGVLHGDVEENGTGVLAEWGNVYHLKVPAQLAAMKRIFSGHDFKSFYNIILTMENNELKVRYKLNGGTVGNGYSSRDDILYLNGSPVTTSAKLLQQLRLVNQDTIMLVKKGYHTVPGQEWIYQGRCFDQTAFYMPKEICPAIGNESRGVIMEANWQANVYTIQYHANGGTGTMGASAMTYDMEGVLKKNVFTREGYIFREWNTKADGTGISYADKQKIKNITEKQGEVITLYARWEPLVFRIAADKQGGTGGTDTFYEKYQTGWFFNEACLNEISSVIPPERKGYHFMSYFEGISGTGTRITDAAGKIQIPAYYFLNDVLIYAHWEPKTFTIAFDKQGGTGGTDHVTASYGEELPAAEAPVRTGFSFQGYYTEKNGGGELYYNEFMASNTRFLAEQDLTLYAYWVDDSEPEVTLTADVSIWTNRDITLTADASDYGAGLSSFMIYCGDNKVAEKTELNGSVREQMTFVNFLEGAITYRAAASDMKGNRAEAFRTVYYDITPPNGVITEEVYDGIRLKLKVEQVTDLNVQ